MDKEITNEEVLAISLKIEGEGAKFYTKLANSIPDPKVKEFLLHMAKEETRHEKQFTDLLEKKGEKIFGWEKSKSVREFIDNEFQTDIFPEWDDESLQAPDVEIIQKAFDFAMDAEKISAEFYSVLSQHCNDYEGRTLLLLLENEEQKHLNYVESLMEKYLEVQDKDK